MILVDTGPLVALFDPKDSYHKHCRSIMKTLREPLLTTVPVITEAFHLLTPGSKGSLALGSFIKQNGMTVWQLEDETLKTALILMEKYADKPMDLADASLVVAAQCLGISRVFTVDRRDFFVYRLSIGHEIKCFEVIG